MRFAIATFVVIGAVKILLTEEYIPEKMTNNGSGPKQIAK